MPAWTADAILKSPVSCIQLLRYSRRSYRTHWNRSSTSHSEIGILSTLDIDSRCSRQHPDSWKFSRNKVRWENINPRTKSVCRPLFGISNYLWLLSTIAIGPLSRRYWSSQTSFEPSWCTVMRPYIQKLKYLLIFRSVFRLDVEFTSESAKFL
jgi:hypothetical protein